jgi:hypothetical protein
LLPVGAFSCLAETCLISCLGSLREDAISQTAYLSFASSSLKSFALACIDERARRETKTAASDFAKRRTSKLLYLAFYSLACHATECIEDERNTLDASQKVILHLKSDMAVGKYAEDLGTASHKARLLSAAVSSLRWNAFERKVCVPEAAILLV